MSKSNQFIAFVEKEASSGAITDDQLESIIQVGYQKYGLIRTTAIRELTKEGFVADDDVNYFEELGLTIEELENHRIEETIKNAVEDAWLPRFSRAIDRHTSAAVKEREILNLAKNILSDPKKRKRHVYWLNRGVIYRFSNGDVATNIPELVTLMETHTKEATDALYGNNIAPNLDRVGETRLADAAREIVSQFSKDTDTGFTAMVAILLGEVRMQNGEPARTPQQLAQLIDNNWIQAKTQLYNGFFALWLKYTHTTPLANADKNITNKNSSDKDIGLEEFVQKLDGSIGHPEPEVSPKKIDFGRLKIKSEKTIDLEITNPGRGFLYGDVQIEPPLQGLQISDTQIRGGGVISVKLDTSGLTPNEKHQTNLVLNTKSGKEEIPISCFITYPVQQSIQRVAFSGLSLAAIAIVARLIVQQVGTSGWLATHLTGAGFIEWGHYWQWVEWFKWPWFEWSVYTLSGPGTGLGFIIAFALLGVGTFGYWYYFFKKNIFS